MSLVLILVAILVMTASGLSGLFFRRRSAWGQRVAAAMSVLAAATGLVGAGLGFAHQEVEPLLLPFTVMGGRPCLAVDVFEPLFSWFPFS